VHSSGVAAGSLSAPRSNIAVPAQVARKGGAEPLAGIGAADRLDRRDQAQMARRAENDAPIVVTDIEDGYSRAGHRQHAPSSAFLAQHIAQEVEPEDPAFSTYRTGTQAYAMRRDSTIEFMSADNRLDIFV
jgi:hypothetical protein